jgi:hypothetical protein
VQKYKFFRDEEFYIFTSSQIFFLNFKLENFVQLILLKTSIYGIYLTRSTLRT